MRQQAEREATGTARSSRHSVKQQAQHKAAEAEQDLQLVLVGMLHDLHLVQALLLGYIIKTLHFCCQLILMLSHSCLPLPLQHAQLLSLLLQPQHVSIDILFDSEHSTLC